MRAVPGTAMLNSVSSFHAGTAIITIPYASSPSGHIVIEGATAHLLMQELRGAFPSAPTCETEIHAYALQLHDRVNQVVQSLPSDMVAQHTEAEKSGHSCDKQPKLQYMRSRHSLHLSKCDNCSTEPNYQSNRLRQLTMPSTTAIFQNCDR